MPRSPLLALLVLLSAAGCTDYGFVGEGARNGGTSPGTDTPTDPTDPTEPGDGGTEVQTDGGTDAETGGDGGTPEDSGTPVDTGTPPDEPGEPQAGCADGAREGYTSWDDYPDIAACSGAWSVGGVTRDDLAPTCGRAAGDDGANVEGSGCSAADVCAEGWHVCDGQAEVADKAGSCDAAVPAGSPDKSLFFAVSQHSVENTVCDDGASEANDVFGCGNLGTQLSADKGCGPLNRALASMNPDSCGFNEAEPNLGPWECEGDDDSHYAEGSLVTKAGCTGWSCSYDGVAVGNSDKGGVLCCRD